MRLIDADELMEHVYRDRLDSRKLIAQMIEKMPTEKAIPLSVIENIKADFIKKYPKNYAGSPELGGNSCVFSLNDVLEIINKHSRY